MRCDLAFMESNSLALLVTFWLCQAFVIALQEKARQNTNKAHSGWRKPHRSPLTEIPALPWASFPFCAHFSTGHKQRSDTCRGRKKNGENEINICLKIASRHGEERFEDIILKSSCEWGQEKKRLSRVKYERHILPDSLWLLLILPTPARWSDP